MTLTQRTASDRTFESSWIRQGYAPDDVEALRSQIVSALQMWEQGAGPGGPRWTGASAVPVTAQELRRARFTIVRFGGYDVDQVDSFLDEAEAALAAYEARSGTPVRAAAPAAQAPDRPPALTADQAARTTFPTSRGAGYQTDEVDAFMDEIILCLQAWEARSGGTRPATGGPAGALRADDVLNKELCTTRPLLQKGYEQDAVDEFLDEVVEVLRVYESQNRAEPR